MNAPLYLSRAELRRDAKIATLAPVLLPSDEGARTVVAHRLVWSLFAGDGAKGRDFLWHEERPGLFLVQSLSPPPANDLFAVQTSEFKSFPAAGQRLRFFLRANPTISVRRSGEAAADFNQRGRKKAGRRVDLIMHRLHSEIPKGRGPTEPLVPKQGRAFLRDSLLGWLPDETSATPDRPIVDWLAKQGASAGFALEQAQITAYRRQVLPREGGKPAVFGYADIEGFIRITESAAFDAAWRRGFGRAKAFGCGLMLLKRD